MKSKILITGSNGFLGEEVVNFFAKDNLIVALDKNSPINFLNEKNVIKYQADIRDFKKIESIFQKEKINIVIHCAAEILDEKNTDIIWETNYQGTKNLLDLAEKNNVEKFIFTSTFSIFEKNYTSPIDEEELPSAVVQYGKSKYAAENLILKHTYRGDIVIFRCPVIIGKKRLDKLALLFEMVRQNLDIWLVGDGENKIHFIYSLDLINAINLSILLKGKHLFNVGSEKVNKLSVIFQKLLNHSGSKRKIKKFPKILGILILKILNIFGQVSLGPYHQRMLVSNCVLKIDKIKSTLNWYPKYTNGEMLIDCYDHYVSTINTERENTSSKKLPNLKVIKILKLISF